MLELDNRPHFPSRTNALKEAPFFKCNRSQANEKTYAEHDSTTVFENTVQKK